MSQRNRRPAQPRLQVNRRAFAVLAVALAAWAALAWLAFDMGHPLARLTMPATSTWSTANVVAVFSMWAVMMAAMMLPSALPMVRAFADVSDRSGEPERGRTFVAAYLVLWFAFSAGASWLQWLLQRSGWIDPMIKSSSAWLTVALLCIAGVYQFSPLKRTCLAWCRSPIGFVVGEWRPGASGAFVMGARHGMLCIGCCWALMALLFVGGAMNLAWVGALAVAVAIEKLAPGGHRISMALGVLLLAAAALDLWALTG